MRRSCRRQDDNGDANVSHVMRKYLIESVRGRNEHRIAADVSSSCVGARVCGRSLPLLFHSVCQDADPASRRLVATSALFTRVVRFAAV